MSMKHPHQTLGLRLVATAVAAVALAPPLGAQTPAERPAAGHSAALKSGTPVTLNFVNAEIEAVTRAMGAMLNRQFIVDPRVKGNITVYSETPLSVREAYLNYLAALRGLGFTVVENAGLLKVVPEADGKLQAGTVSIGDVKQRGDQILTQIFRLNHENPNNLVAVLRPLISPNNTINANPASSTLVITDYADNLARLGKIIAALDQPSASDIEVVALQHGVASDMAPLVQRLADGTPGAAPGAAGAGAGAGGAISVIADARSNSLIVRAASPARQAQVRSIIDKLDRPSQGGGPGGTIWVVHLKNADAVKMAAVLRAAFTTGGAGGGGGGSQITATAAQPGGATPATTPIQASAGPSTGGFIQADPATNSLVITAAEPLYRQVRSMIDQLDSRRAQVYIESLLVEVTGDNAADVGFQWAGLIGKDGDKNIGRDRHQPGQQPRAEHHRHQYRRGGGHRGPWRRSEPRADPRLRRQVRAVGDRAVPADADQHQHHVDAEPDHPRQRGGEDRDRQERAIRHRAVHQYRHRHDQPVPDRRAQGRRPDAAHQAADRRGRHGAHDDLPGSLGRDQRRPPAPWVPARPPASDRSSRTWSSTTARSWCSAA